MVPEGVADGYFACGVYVANDDTVVINAGTFNITDGAGIVARSGSTTVKSGVVFNMTTTNSSVTSGRVGDSRVVIPSGKELVIDNAANYPGGAPTLTNETSYEVYTINNN